jgi:tryptophan synthase beta chain
VDNPEVQIVLAEAGGKGIDSGESAATIQLGRMGIIHGAKTLVMQSEDGQIEEPYSISAGLDYPGIGPFHANLSATKRALILAVDDQRGAGCGLRTYPAGRDYPGAGIGSCPGCFAQAFF